MIEGEDDQSYRVHLLKGSWGLLGARLWGKAVWAREPTYYDGDEIRVQLSFSSAYAGTLHLYALDLDGQGRGGIGGIFTAAGGARVFCAAGESAGVCGAGERPGVGTVCPAPQSEQHLVATDDDDANAT